MYRRVNTDIPVTQSNGDTIGARLAMTPPGKRVLAIRIGITKHSDVASDLAAGNDR